MINQSLATRLPGRARGVPEDQKQSTRRRHRTSRASLLLILLLPLPSAAGLLALVTDTNGQPVADAVVYATPRGGRPAPPPGAPTERVAMDQRNREFMPYVLAVQTGTPVYFPNSDNIRHHVYSFSPAKTFELPLYQGTPAAPVVFDKPGAVALGCNIHDWMVGYIYVVDTPWFAKTADNGNAGLALPGGEYDIRVWHPRLKGSADATLRPVAVGANNGVRVEFRITLNPDRRKQRPTSHEYDTGDYNY